MMGMKSSLVLLCCSLALGLVQGADWAVFVALNNGVAQADMWCSHEEWNLAQDAMDTAVPDRRQRRHLREENGMDIARRAGRSLEWCQIRCAPYAPGMCKFVYWQCAVHGLRRTEEVPDKEDQGRDDRQLNWATNTCSQDIGSINAALDAVTVNVTDECKALINAPRNLTCVDVSVCDIESFYLRDIASGSITIPNYPVSGGEICRNTTTNARVTFGVETAVCVENVQFTVTGPNGLYFRRTDWRPPFNLFSTSVAGSTLWPVGSYTLKASVGTDQSTLKKIDFVVKDCSATSATVSTTP